ncbi:hypothetical protein RM553_01000 [Zunongwangia sp. F363]|uniref:Uncharacterized protein n=1 Tax=Autumnicola tepida TaxID=3075595 RepID=A0ABU3C4Y4_9FLAO|nr:hypothetical protein [Zunongwangia sp. F363]MDT0641396.1 hypothetical protein [Zunongwangia sp. F363]
MKEKIESLTDEQAQHALLRFYELLPEEFWQGSRLTFGDFEFWQEEIQEAATPEIQPFLKAVEDEADPSARGETSRLVLKQMAAHKDFQPYLEQAVEEAKIPHMAPIPEIIIAATIVLAAMPKEIEWNNSAGNQLKIKLGHLDSAAEFIKSITSFLKESKGLLPF